VGEHGARLGEHVRHLPVAVGRLAAGRQEPEPVAAGGLLAKHRQRLLRGLSRFIESGVGDRLVLRPGDEPEPADGFFLVGGAAVGGGDPEQRGLQQLAFVAVEEDRRLRSHARSFAL
jgi:hypothetical protein